MPKPPTGTAAVLQTEPPASISRPATMPRREPVGVASAEQGPHRRERELPQDTTAQPRAKLFEQIGEYQEVDTAVARKTLPVFDAIVVYVGSQRHKSVPLRGHMLVELLEDPDGHRTEKLTPVPGEGIQCYDFSTHGTDGRPLRDHLVPVNADNPQFSNRRAMRVSHPDHLVWFHKHREVENGPPAFVVLVAPHQRQAWLDFISKSQRFDAETNTDTGLVEAVIKEV